MRRQIRSFPWKLPYRREYKETSSETSIYLSAAAMEAPPSSGGGDTGAARLDVQPNDTVQAVVVGASTGLIALEGEAHVQVLLDKMNDAGMRRVQEFAALLQQCSLNTLGSLGMFYPNLPALCEQLFADVPPPLGHLQASGYFASIAVRPARPLCSRHVTTYLCVCCLHVPAALGYDGSAHPAERRVHAGRCIKFTLPIVAGRFFFHPHGREYFERYYRAAQCHCAACPAQRHYAAACAHPGGAEVATGSCRFFGGGHQPCFASGCRINSDLVRSGVGGDQRGGTSWRCCEGGLLDAPDPST